MNKNILNYPNTLKDSFEIMTLKILAIVSKLALSHIVSGPGVSIIAGDGTQGPFVAPWAQLCSCASLARHLP